MSSIQHGGRLGRRHSWAALVLALAALLLLLGGCGGESASVPIVGAAGGTVSGPAGTSVVVPPGALAGDVAVAMDASASGAPALPAGAVLGSDVFALTPHGTTFAKPVTVRLPADASRVAAGLTPTLYKTNAAGVWERVPGAVVAGGFVTGEVTGFSWFAFLALPPTITTQPANVAVTEPAAAAFEVVALGAPPFSYQWQRSNDGGSSWANLPGATQRTLALASTAGAAAASGGDNGARIRVIVSNPDGAATSQAAVLNVSPMVALPTITSQPINVTVAPGVDAGFSVRASGTSLTYQWQRSNDGGTTWSDLAGQTNASVLLTAVQLADSGAHLRVQVASAAGAVASAAALLTVVPTPPPPSGSGSPVAAGYDFSAIAVNPGSGLSWGGFDHLGVCNGAANRLAPGPLPLVNAIAVAAGAGHGGAIDDQGRAWVWGGNSFGQLGTGSLSPACALTQNAFGSRYQALSLGGDHSLWLRTDGRIEAAGYNGTGALGQPSSVYLSQSLLVVPGNATYTAVAAGNFFSLAVRADGTLWVWGSNGRGQYGTAPATDGVHRHTPVQVAGLPVGLRAVAAGSAHALALDNTGQVWAWGETSNGKLGIGSTSASWAPPTRVALSGNFIAIACGAEFSLALRDDGVLYVWGIDETGQLGQGRNLGMSNLPLVVPGLPPIKAMDGGWGLGHTLAAGRDGSLWAWGRNDAGQLGDGTRVDRNTPVRVLPPLSIP